MVSQIFSNLKRLKSMAISMKKASPMYEASVNDDSDKKTISDTMRNQVKVRFLNALNQAKELHGRLLLDFEACAEFLEMECYKKYGKVGKTFYNSQVAATFRWLSHSSMEQIQDKFRDITAQTCSSGGQNKFSLDVDSHLVQQATTAKATDDQVQDNALADFSELVAMKGPKERIDLPPIPSFSEFVSKKRKEHSSGSSIARISSAGKHVSKNKEKRIRLQ